MNHGIVSRAAVVFGVLAAPLFMAGCSDGGNVTDPLNQPPPGVTHTAGLVGS